MIWARANLPPEVRALLERERIVAILPVAARERALARARATLAVGVATPSNPPPASSTVSWVAAAAGLACLATVVAAATAYEVAVRGRSTVPATASPPPYPAASLPRMPERPIIDLPDAPRPSGRAATSGSRAAREELRLLEQARTAVAQEDFMAANRLLAEHAHRFKAGWLAEEREALRVRVLAGLGRRDEARRAAAAFETCFPRSPLLSTISQKPDS
jgi:hypothetical protein